jgi:hypothetical protein
MNTNDTTVLAGGALTPLGIVAAGATVVRASR